MRWTELPVWQESLYSFMLTLLLFNTWLHVYALANMLALGAFTWLEYSSVIVNIAANVLAIKYIDLKSQLFTAITHYFGGKHEPHTSK
jgi:hypothetical protein